MRTPPSPCDLGLPHDHWRTGQRDTVEQVLEALDEYPNVLLNAPTGSGKTVVASAVRRLRGSPSLGLTHSIALQHQYLQTAEWAHVVTGRNNHACEIDVLKILNTKADTAPCAEGAQCTYIRPDGCSYYKMLYATADEEEVITNYAYAARIVRSPRLLRKWCECEQQGCEHVVGGNPFRRPLLICDEGHLAESAIIDSVTLNVDTSLARNYESPTGCEVNDWIRWARSALPDVTSLLETVRREALCPSHGYPHCEACSHRPSAKVVGHYRRVSAFVSALTRLVDATDEWVVTFDGHAAQFRPLWGWLVSKAALFQYFESVLVMSATLGDPEIIARKLGFTPGSWKYIEVPSYFPKENRPLFYWPVVSVNRNITPSGLDRLARAINYLAEQPNLQGRKGIVHTPSFELAERLFERLARVSDRYVPHLGSRSVKDELIKRLREDDRPLIGISPSLGTGLDIPYEIGFQVIAKVPFANLGDPITRQRLEYDDGDHFGKRNYDAEAFNAIVQAYGRAVRAPDDTGVSYILDSNFRGLYNRVHVPQFVKEAFKWVK